MAGTLRDDLASLKIDRQKGGGWQAPRNGNSGGVGLALEEDFPPVRTRRRRDGGVAFLSLALWLVPLTLFGGAGYYAYKQYDAIRPKTEVSVGIVQSMTTGEAEKLMSAKGYLKARHQASVGSKALGRVERIVVEEGSRVKTGELLGELDHREMDARLRAQEATIQKTAAELMESQVDLKEKEREAARARRLYAGKTISIEEMEKAEAAKSMAAARVVGLEASLSLAKATAQETAVNIDNMKLIAPFNGTVIKKECEVGDILTPAAFSNLGIKAYLVQLASLEDMEVETDVAENLLSRIGIDQPAEVSVSAVPGKHYRGVLRQIIPLSDRARGTVKVNVKILDPDEKLFPELVATVHFLPKKGEEKTAASQSYLFVPKSSIFEENGHTYAWVLDAKMKATKAAVEVAPTNDELARVETGLTAGQTVVVNPPKGLRENEIVSVAE